MIAWSGPCGELPRTKRPGMLDSPLPLVTDLEPLGVALQVQALEILVVQRDPAHPRITSQG